MASAKTKDTRNTGARLLERYLRRHKLSLAAMAEKLGCSKQYIGFLKNGNKTPSLATAIRLREIAGIPESSWAS